MSRAARGVLAACALLTACSTATSAGPNTSEVPASHPSEATASPAAARLTPLQAAQVRDSATHAWPLTDISAGSRTAVDLVTAAFPTRLVGGPVLSTPGPDRALTAARFTGKGRIVTPVKASDLAADRTFTLEFAFRSDDCTKAWSHVLGTGAHDTRGRQGLNVLHYPQDFSQACRMAFELWKNDRYTGGCSTPDVVTHGRWELFAMTYSASTITCFADGKKVGSSSGVTWFSEPGTAFGIGGAGSGWGGSLDSGSLADVAIYDKALTPLQIASHAKVLNRP